MLSHLIEKILLLQFFNPLDDSPDEIRTGEEVIYSSLRPNSHNLSSHSQSGETDNMNPYAAVNKVVVDESPYSNLQRGNGVDSRFPAGNLACSALDSGREIQLTCGIECQMSENIGTEETPSHSLSSQNQSLTML